MHDGVGMIFFLVRRRFLLLFTRRGNPPATAFVRAVAVALPRRADGVLCPARRQLRPVEVVSAGDERAAMLRRRRLSGHRLLRLPDASGRVAPLREAAHQRFLLPLPADRDVALGSLLVEASAAMRALDIGVCL